MAAEPVNLTVLPNGLTNLTVINVANQQQQSPLSGQTYELSVGETYSVSATGYQTQTITMGYSDETITLQESLPDNIADAILAAQGRVADCYTAISAKGGTLPQTQNLANMPTAINSISGGGGGSSTFYCWHSSTAGYIYSNKSTLSTGDNVLVISISRSILYGIYTDGVVSITGDVITVSFNSGGESGTSYSRDSSKDMIF